MKKAKERLDAEATYKMTWRQRVDNAWFYYKWWLLGSVIVLSLVLLMIHDIRTNVEPDYTIGLLSPGYLSEQMVTDLQNVITPFADDRNGDGQVVVFVSTYNLAVGDSEPSDPMAHAAAITRLSGDMQMGDSMFFITDQAEAYNKVFDFFAYNDGSLPPEGGPYDMEQLGIPMSDCPVFAGVDRNPEALWKMDDFRLVRRCMEGTPLMDKPKKAAYYKDSMVLLDKLTAK